jgi:hypothetical protein
MLNDDDILDAPQSNIPQKLPFDTKTEMYMYIGIIFFQYLLMPVGAAVVALILHPFTHLVQFLSSVISYANDKDPKKLVHFTLLVLCLVLGFVSIDFGMRIFFLITMPHGLAWFYIYILHAQQKERERLLPLYKPVKKRK